MKSCNVFDMYVVHTCILIIFAHTLSPRPQSNFPKKGDFTKKSWNQCFCLVFLIVMQPNICLFVFEYVLEDVDGFVDTATSSIHDSEAFNYCKMKPERKILFD